MNFLKKHISFNEIVSDFLSEKEITLSKKTYKDYLGKIRVFKSWLHDKNFDTVSLRKIDNSIISEFFVYLAKYKQLDRPTCEKYFLNLRSLFRFALKRNYIDHTPFDLVIFPAKKKDMSSEVIAKNDLIKLLNLIKEKDFQLYFACMIQFYCFVRPGSELRLMKVEDIDLEQGIIKIPLLRAKNRTTEIVTIPTQLIELCKEYGLVNADKSLFVFGKKGCIGNIPWSVNMLTYHFNKYRNILKLSKGIKFYSMKHTGAMALHYSGCPIRNEMDQLRHKNLAASQHYIKKHGGMVDEIIRNNFPNPL